VSYESKEKFKELSEQDLDERVHVCFYFFSGPRIQAEDL
jgi:septin 7/cell division control protein 12